MLLNDWTKIFIYNICKFITDCQIEAIHYFIVKKRIIKVFFSIFGYRKKLLTDLERYLKVGELRINSVFKNGEYYEQKKLQKNKVLRIAFFGTFGREANFPKDFFKNHPNNVEVYLYDLIRPKKRGYQGTTIFDNCEGITYKKINNIPNWMISTLNYDIFLKQIEEDNIDVFVNIVGDYLLPLFDKCTVPVLLHLATSSLPMPHKKFLVQGFVQPPWPYSVEQNKILNLKTNKLLDSIFVLEDGLLFNLRAAKVFKKLTIKEKKKQMFFSGNLKKLAKKEILDIIAYVLSSDSSYKFVYYGGGDQYQSIIEDFFKNHNLEKKVTYKGSYVSEFDKNGQLLDDGNVYSAYQDLFESRLFINTFPFGGARSCLEAYYADVAVINLNINNEKWITQQELQPFKLPMLLGKYHCAESVYEYKFKCVKIMENDDLYQKIIKEQNLILKNCTDIDLMWEKIFFMIRKDQKIKLESENCA